MILGVAVVLALVASVAVTAARFVDPSFHLPILLASFSAYGLPGFLLALVGCLLLLRRTRRGWVVAGAVLAVLGLGIQVWAVSPLFTGGSEGEAELTVLVSNLEFGQGDAVTVTRTVAEEDVDLLVLAEVTPAALDELLAAGLDDLLPHRAGTPHPQAAGTMVFSRRPLDPLVPMTMGNGGLEVRVRGAEPFRLLAVHPAQPVGWPRTWLRDLDTVRERAAAASGPMLVAGDLNATRDHEPFRAILDTGLRDAAEQAGSGWQPTWPAAGSWGPLRPLLMIDHVLASPDFVALETSTVKVPGSDHLALLARLRVAD